MKKIMVYQLWLVGQVVAADVDVVAVVGLKHNSKYVIFKELISIY